MMSNFDHLTELASSNQRLKSKLGLFNPVMDMVERQQKLYSSLGISETILKNFPQYDSYKKNDLGNMAALIGAQTHMSKIDLQIPAYQNYFTISRQFSQLLSSLVHHYKTGSFISQARSLEHAFGDLAKRMSCIHAMNKLSIEDLEDITEEAIALNGKLLDSEKDLNLTLSEISEFFHWAIEKIKTLTFNNENFWKLLSLIGFVFAMSGEVRHWLKKEDGVRKEEFENLLNERFNQIDYTLKELKEYSTVKRPCKIYLKPTSKTVVMTVIPVHSEVLVLYVNHKWVYISYFNPAEGIPEPGWVLKKYLESPQ